jgi:hypothetical protein
MAETPHDTSQQNQPCITKEAHMTVQRRPARSARPQSSFTLAITSLSILVFTLMMFLLAQSMVRHHFFSGSHFLHH